VGRGEEENEPRLYGAFPDTRAREFIVYVLNNYYHISREE
jgi:hypothetical protein